MARLATLFASLVPFYLSSSMDALCVRLDPLPFGNLLLNGSDVTLGQREPVINQTVDYQCAEGYQLVDAIDTSHVLNLTTTVCMESGNWTLTEVACMMKECSSPPVSSNIQVFRNSSVYSLGTVVTYRCDPGYRIESYSNVVDSRQAEVISVCTRDAEWHLVPTCVAVGESLSAYNVLVVVLAVVAALLALALCTTFSCTLWACKMREELTKGDMAKDEVLYTHSHTAFMLNNPLVVNTHDESVGHPLYLTPDEMDEFESKKRHLGDT